ncbi:hypothetical protein GWN42_10155 [candidate division KSB1 bacterium]|nr:hypothetical protein [candidate division KSB1 bacterium]
MKGITFLLKISWLLPCIGALFISACDFLDAGDVTNPQTTDQALRDNSKGATTPFLVGVQERFSDSIEDLTIFTDTVSDNYDNTSTFISPQADIPAGIRPDDLTLDGVTGSGYFETQELRALADFGIKDVFPNDPDATDDQLAELLFFRGMASVLVAENFGGAPIEEDGRVLTPEEHLDLAVADFNESLATSQNGDLATRNYLALARASRLAGDAANAGEAADMALASGESDFVFFAQYDPANNVNRGFTFAVSRGQNDLQPLPRLDFLDPKYIARDANIPALKMEEAHLIKAEVALANGDFSGAVQSLVEAISLSQSRPVIAFADADPRTGRPQSGAVQASPSAPAIDDLLIPRNGSQVQVRPISGTSLEPSEVASLSDPVEILYTLYLARQEIFFFESRRMSDLGIRLPMQNREIETNPSIKSGDPGTAVFVPSYIPPDDGLDRFSVSGNVTVIEFDMNQVLAENRVSPFALPF